MIWVVMGLWVTCILIFLFTRGYNKDGWKGINKKEHPLSMLYPTCYFLYKKFGINRCLQRENRIRVAINSIAAKGHERLELELFFLKRVSVCFFCFFCLLSLMFITELSKKLSQGQSNPEVIERPISKMEPPTSRTMIIDSEYEDTISFQIAPKRKESVDEAQVAQNQRVAKKCEESIKQINQMLLGTNPEASYIGRPIVLPNEIPKEQVSVSWTTSNADVVGVDGIVHNEKLTKPVEVLIKAILAGKDEGILGDYEWTLKVIPKKEFEYQMWKEELIVQIEQDEEGEQIHLPESYDGHKIQWEAGKDFTTLKILLFSVLICIIVYIAMNERLISDVKKRKEQMLVDYSGIVNKLALLISAGMTVTGAWQRMVEDYEQLSKTNKKPRYAYEQMKLTNQEMKLGVSEIIAFGEFGRRCMSVEYMKLASVLVQNLRKGADGIVQTLYVMSGEAFEQRKNRARQIGEKAGTKLLFPMLMMLVLVLVIIMVPAFWSMRL